MAVSFLEVLKRGIEARIPGVVSNKLSYLDDRGEKRFLLQIATLGKTLSIPLDSQDMLDLAPPVGTELRAFAPIGRSRTDYSASIKTGMIRYSTANQPDWGGPLTEQEILDGPVFDGCAKVMGRDTYIDKRDGVSRYTATVAAMGDVFGFRDLRKELWDMIPENGVVLASGRLENDLRWTSGDASGAGRGITSKLLIIVDVIKPYKKSLEKTNPAA